MIPVAALRGCEAASLKYYPATVQPPHAMAGAAGGGPGPGWGWLGPKRAGKRSNAAQRVPAGIKSAEPPRSRRALRLLWLCLLWLRELRCTSPTGVACPTPYPVRLVAATRLPVSCLGSDRPCQLRSASHCRGAPICSGCSGCRARPAGLKSNFIRLIKAILYALRGARPAARPGCAACRPATP